MANANDASFLAPAARGNDRHGSKGDMPESSPDVRFSRESLSVKGRYTGISQSLSAGYTEPNVGDNLGESAEPRA